jgi:ATP-dependent helicase/nuclease subunit B
MLRVLQSPSAAERITVAAEFIRSFAAATELLLVGSSREAVDELVRGLAQASGATFGLHRFSLTQLAARLATPKLALDGLAPATSLGNDAVAARAVYEALAKGGLMYFDPVARFPGFARATASTLSELRAAGVTTDDLQLLDASAGDIAALLCQFEEQRAAASIADRTVLLRTAAETVRAGGPLVRCPMLFLDVPIHSAAERDLAAALAESSPELLIVSPAGDARTLLALKALSGFKEVETRPVEPKSSLARLGQYLFSEAAPPTGKADDDVVFFSAPGEERECVEISRRIMEQAAAGIRFDQIAILLRNPGSYSGLMETALRRAGIPAFFARGSRRPDPSGRALLALLACAAEGLSAHRFAEYLSFAQVPQLCESGEPRPTERIVVLPEDEALGVISSAMLPGLETPRKREAEQEAPDHEGSPELEGSLRTPWKWEQLIVEAAVIGGRDRWVRRLNGLENQLRLEGEACAKDDPGSPRLQGLERSLRNLEHLRAFALPIIEELAALPGAASWGEWISYLERIVPKTLRRPERVLAVLADMKPMAPVQSVSLEEVRTVLHLWLANVQEEPPAYRYGRVFVGTPEQARGRSFEIVFLPGLAERVFPQKLREDPLLLDNLRKKLSPELCVLADRSQQERLLLQIAVGAARRKLYVSYPRLVIAEARPRVPSFYALDVMRSITGRVPDYEVLEREAERIGDSRLAWPAPREPRRAIDDSEYDLAVLWPLLGQPGVERKSRLAYVMQLNEHLARSLRSRWARWKPEWSQYDGLCKRSTAVTEILREYQLSSRPYSVSALQKFAVCPYQFLLSGIYRLEPREEPAPIEQVDPLTRGEMFHRIQAELLRELQKSGGLPLTAQTLPAAWGQLDQTVDAIARQYHEELAPAIDRVWRDAVELMRADLRVWLEKLTATSRWIPIHFEFGFGFKAREGRDPASLSEAVTLPSGEHLHGFVDLIERSVDGQHLRVTDHKTGRNYTGKGLVVGQGEVLQPVLYGLAVETALKRTVVESRLFFCTAAGGFSERVVPLNEIARENGTAVLRTIERAIASGFLVPAPREDACSRCDFQEVCGPYEEIRISQKAEHSQLVQLRTVRDLA